MHAVPRPRARETVELPRVLAKKAKQAERLLLASATRPSIAVDEIREALATAFDVGRMMDHLDELPPTLQRPFHDLVRALFNARRRLSSIPGKQQARGDADTAELIRGLGRLNECALAQVRRGILVVADTNTSPRVRLSESRTDTNECSLGDPRLSLKTVRSPGFAAPRRPGEPSNLRLAPTVTLVTAAIEPSGTHVRQPRLNVAATVVSAVLPMALCRRVVSMLARTAELFTQFV